MGALETYGTENRRRRFVNGNTITKNIFQAHSNTTANIIESKLQWRANVDAQFGYQCVGFVKATMNTLLGTKDWKGGEFISFQNKPSMYSIIAIFDPNDGEYKNDVEQSHVAIYLTSDSDKITVVDQNHDGEFTLAVHTIPWNSTGVKRRDSAINYQLVMKNSWNLSLGPIMGSRLFIS